jgi:hypothetical protein
MDVVAVKVDTIVAGDVAATADLPDPGETGLAT